MIFSGIVVSISFFGIICIYVFIIVFDIEFIDIIVIVNICILFICFSCLFDMVNVLVFFKNIIFILKNDLNLGCFVILVSN